MIGNFFEVFNINRFICNYWLKALFDNESGKYVLHYAKPAHCYPAT